MVKVKEIPYDQRYANALDIIKLNRTFVLSFIQKQHRCREAMVESQGICQNGLSLFLARLL